MDKFTLRQFRLMREISQEKMANMLEVHVNTYITWEKEPERIPVGKAMTICKILDTNMDTIIFCS